MTAVINSDWGEAKSKDAESCLAVPWWLLGLVFSFLIDWFRHWSYKRGEKQPLSILSIDTDVFLSHELAEAILACISSWGKITTFVGFFVSWVRPLAGLNQKSVANARKLCWFLPVGILAKDVQWLPVCLRWGVVVKSSFEDVFQLL